MAGENATVYLPGDLKARAKAAAIPLSFSLQQVVSDVLAFQADPSVRPSRTVRAVLDEMERRAAL
jgi:hypothetical protein